MKGERNRRPGRENRESGGEQRGGASAGSTGNGITGSANGADEEYFRLLVENVNDVITVINADGTIRYMSPSNERYSGYESSELLGVNPLQFIHHDDLPAVSEALARLIAAPGSMEETEYRIRTKDGNWRYVHAVAKNMLDHPLINGIVLTATDLSELEAAKSVLLERESNYQAIIESLSDVVFTIDGEGRFSYVSPAIERISHFKVEDVLGRPFSDFVYPEDIPQLALSLRRTLEGEVEPHEFRVVDKTGEVHLVRTSSRPVMEGGEVVGVAGVMADITEMKAVHETAALFKAIADSANYGVAITDLSGDIVYVNEYFARVHGYDVSELKGEKINVFHNEEQLPSVLELTGAMRGGMDFNAVEVWHTRRGGGDFPMLMNLMLVRDAGGRPRYMATTAVDITERKAWEDALRESEEKYRDLFENASDLIQSVTPEGRFVYVNRAWMKTLGYSPQEVSGLTLFDIIHPESMGHCMEMFERVMAGETVSVEAKFVASDGREVMVEGTASCRFEEGRPVSTRGIFRDITMRKAIEEELRGQREHLEELVEERTLGIMQANERLQEEIARRIRVGEQLEERNRELDAFAHTVSHDLRGSLSLIRGFAVIARAAVEKGEYGELEECLNSIEVATRRMEDFVVSILAYARARHPAGEAERVDAAAILRQVIEENAAGIERLGIEVDVQEELPEVKADPPHVYQVLSNLVGNAVKYMGDCPRPRIEVSCRECGDMAVFRVSDTGMGIPEEEQEGIFTPFKRCSGPEYPGLGIGLSTVKRAVEGWNGKVWVESAPGEGTSFYFSIPTFRD